MVAEFFTQLREGYVNRAIERLLGTSAYRFDELLAGEHPPGVLDQDMEEIKLVGRQVEGRGAHRDAARRWIEGEGTDRYNPCVGAGPAAGPSSMDTNTSQ